VRRTSAAILALLCLALPFSLASATDRMATVDGFCFLEGEADHSGIKVLFEAVSPSAETDSVFTAATGYYLIGLSEGIYTVHFSKDGFQPYTLPGEYTFGGDSYTLPDVTLSPGTSLEVSGNVSGEWTSETSYLVVGDIIVQAGDTLLIHAGTQVQFMGVFTLSVYGGFYAVGAEEDSVVFTSGITFPAPGDWKRIQFLDDGSSPSHGVLEFCVLEFGGLDTGQWDKDANLSFLSSWSLDNIRVENCSIRLSDTAGIACEFTSPSIIGNSISWNSEEGIRSYYDSSPLIVGNLISGNLDDGIYCQVSSPSITENTISGNQRGIFCAFESSPLISGNSISENQNEGIYCSESSSHISGNTITNNIYEGIDCVGVPSPVVRGNTIAGNDVGVYSRSDSEPQILLNIVSENRLGISAYSQPSEIIFNDVWNNYGDNFYGSSLPFEIGVPITVNANGDSCDTYFNISFDPEFVAEDDFHLLLSSPCIDAGPDSILDPDGTRADMGAFPYFQGDPDAPEVDFTPSVTSGSSPLPVQFTHSNTGGPITSWLWSFGDGTSSTLVNPVHTYVVEEPDTFTVSLMVEGPGGSDVASYADLIIIYPATFPPMANFSADPLVGYGPVQFTDMSAGEIDTYSWDFGDGIGTSAEEDPAYTYTDPGLYTVTLEVSGPQGDDTEVKTDYITILDPEEIIAGFEPSATYGVVPATIQFTNTSIGTIDGYFWNFGDNGYSTEEDPVHSYEESGLFEVSMIAFGPADADTAYATIEVLDPEPVITAIEDVPDDQGEQVYVRFTRSGHDTDGPRSTETYAIERDDDGVWTTVASGVAYGADSYQFLAPTLRDSSDVDSGLTEFRVIAGMNEGTFISDPAWGYSVDNIAPGAPTGFHLNWTPEASILNWDESADEDFQYFKIYRGESEDFEPTEENLVHMTAETSWIDTDPDHGIYYKLSAVDDAGNEGDPVNPEIVTDNPEMPYRDRFALYPCMPNPFNPSTTILFDLPSEGGQVSLKIYDVEGRLVRELLDGHLNGGRHSVEWKGQNDFGAGVVSGIYFYRLDGDGFSETRKMSLLK